MPCLTPLFRVCVTQQMNNCVPQMGTFIAGNLGNAAAPDHRSQRAATLPRTLLCVARRGPQQTTQSKQERREGEIRRQEHVHSRDVCLSACIATPGRTHKSKRKRQCMTACVAMRDTQCCCCTSSGTHTQTRMLHQRAAASSAMMDTASQPAFKKPCLKRQAIKAHRQSYQLCSW